MNKIKLYMYASNICIKKIKIPKGTNIMNETYCIRVWFKKFIFGSNYVKIIVRPTHLKINKENEVHIEVEYYKGEIV